MLKLSAHFSMQVQRDFQPATYLELVQDYAYVIYDDQVDDQARKILKMELFKEALPRVWLNDLPFLRDESAGFSARSLFVIYRQEITRIDPGKSRDLLNFDVKYVTDAEMQEILAKINQSMQRIFADLKSIGGDTYRRLYEIRQRQLQFHTSLEFHAAFDLKNYQTNEAISQVAVNAAKNIVESLKSRLNDLVKKLPAPETTKVQFRLQDFDRRFGKRDLESLELKTTVPPAQCLAVGEQLLYAPIQPGFSLCDDPTSPSFYLNDPRDTFLIGKKQDISPAPRLIIRGNSIQYPSCILQDQQVIKVSEELSGRYTKQEEMMKKAVYMLAKMLVSCINNTTSTYQEIINEIKAYLQNKHANNIDSVEEEIQEIKSRVAAQIDATMVLEEKIARYMSEDPLTFNTQWHINDLLDLDEIAAIWCYEVGQEIALHHIQSYQIENQRQSNKNDDLGQAISMSLTKTVKNTHHDIFDDYRGIQSKTEDSIDIPIKRPTFHVRSEGRSRTMYETVHLLTLMLQYQISTQKNQLNSQQFLKRPYIYHICFNEELTLKDIFVPINRLERLLAQKNKYKNQMELLTFYRQNIKYYKEHTGAPNQLTEDNTGGDCNVCSCQYDNYKHHINSPDHIRNFRKLMMLNDNLQESLKEQVNRLQNKQAIQASLSQLTAKLAIKYNKSYQTAARAINESIRAINFNQQVDEQDVPRTHSPTLQSQGMHNWMEAISKKRVDYLEQCFSKQEIRKNASWRVKQTSPLLAILSKNYVNNFNDSIIKTGINKFLACFSAKKASNQIQSGCLVDNEDSDDTKDDYVLLELQPERLYNFNQEEYEIIQQVVLIIVLLRYCSQQSILRELDYSPIIENNDSNQSKQFYSQNANVMRKKLAMLYPAIKTDNYDNALQELDDKYKQYNIQKQATQTKIMHQMDDNQKKYVYLNQKHLKQELADVEIGLLPQTDQLIRIYMTIFDVKQQDELMQQAIESYERRLLKIIDPDLIYHIKQYLENEKIFIYKNQPIFNFNVMQRVQLPQIYTIKNENVVQGVESFKEIQTNDQTGSSSKQQSDHNYINSVSDEQYLKQLQYKEYLEKPQQEFTAKYTEQSQSYSHYFNYLQQHTKFSMYGTVELKQNFQQILQISKPQYIKLFQMILANLNIAINSAPSISTLVEEVLFDGYQRMNSEEQEQNKQQTIKPSNQLNTMIQLSFNQGGYQSLTRSKSCTTFNQYYNIKQYNGKQVQLKVRSNSIINIDTVQLDNDQVSVVLLGTSNNDEPIITNKVLIDNQINNEEAIQQNQLPGGFFINNKHMYGKYQQIVQLIDQKQQNQQNIDINKLKLVWGDKYTIVSPLLSGNKQFNVKINKPLFLNLQNQQISAIYAALLCHFGYQYFEAKNNLYDIIPDIYFAAAATINTVENMRQHKYLKTLDIMSLITVMLSAQSKLLTNNLQKPIQSKTIERSIPCDLIKQEEIEKIVENDDTDCYVIQNPKTSSRQLWEDLWFTNYSRKQENQ